MKTISTLFLSFAIWITAGATNYPRNGKTGFGGPVGLGSLDITSSGTMVTLTLNKGTNNMNDVLVVYVDAGPGGFNSTSVFTDESSGLMKAISGVDGANRATFNFNSNFTPEFALAMMPNTSGGAVLVALGTGAHTVIGVPVLTNNGTAGAATYSITFDVALLFGTGPIVFNFIGTLISNTAYRSEEAFGDPMTGFAQGWGAYTSTTTPLVYNSATPVTLSSFTGAAKSGNALLSWVTKTESGAAAYNVEKSNNGREWSSIGTVPARNNINGASYTYADTRFSANAYYRLKMLDRDGKFTYSGIVRLTAGGNNNIKLMSNPARGQLTLNIANPLAGQYSLELYAPDSKKMTALNYHHAGGVANVSMPLNGLPAGAYLLRASCASDKQVLKVMVQ